MFVSSEDLVPTSRIWIYQSNRRFSEHELAYISNYLNTFCTQWHAHGHPVKSSFQVRYNQFIILLADENFNSTSGCSIDSSVHAMKEIAKETGADLFNGSLVPFLIEGNVEMIEMNKLKDFFSRGVLNHSSLTFNNLVPSKADLDNNWIVPAGNTWLKRYVVPETSKI